MNKNLKTLCAAVAIALLPIGATCYAQNNVEEKYETIWMEAEQKVEENETKETFANCSLDEVVKLKEDKTKYEASVGKEVIIKIKVTKITVEGDKTHIVTKTGPLQKMKCTVDNTAKTDMSKYKAGDEVVVKGILKDIKGKTVVLDNSTIIKDMGPSGEYNKDKYKNNTQPNNKPDTKVEDNKKEENKKPDIKVEDNKKEEIKKPDTKVEDNKKEEIKKPDTKVEDNKKEETKKPDTKVEDKNKQEIKKVEPSMENNKKENDPNENKSKDKCKKHEMKKHEEKNKCKKPENKVEIKKPQENKKENCPKEQE